MQVRASWRLATLPARTAGPALAAFLVTGAGAAGIAQPIDAQPALAPMAVRAATIRIVLPPPAAMARAPHMKATPTLGPAPHKLDPAVDAATLVSAQPSAAPAMSDLTPAALAPDSIPRPKAAPLRMTPPQGIEAPVSSATSRTQPLSERPAGLAASRGLSEAEYSAALRTLAAKPVAKAIPMVDAESRAALARLNDDYTVSGTDRMEPLQPAPSSARSLIDMAPQRAARPSAVPIRMQSDDGDDETIGRYRRTSQGLAFDVATSVNGKAVGSVSLLIRDGENISVRLADLLTAVRSAIDPALYDRLASSQAAQSYMTFNDLREAGLAVRFNDKDRLILGTR